MMRVAQRVAGDDFLRADDADDVARLDLIGFDLFARIGLDVPNLADQFLLAGPRDSAPASRSSARRSRRARSTGRRAGRPES